MKSTVLALFACTLASCSESEAPYHPMNDAYLVNAFFDAGSDVQAVDVGPAIITLADPMIYIASSEDVFAGSLKATPQGWAVELRPQCTANCAGGRERLQAMVHDGATITIGEDGILVVRTADGRRATGAPTPRSLLD
ncbi:hypothetical protein [Brevundimonas faecalis]|uniref:META domain-containing protein n=1 Tax=Brevundimonas faecalis TaxID=947378 RepID=A0ABV2R7X4_9CAUL